MRPAAALAFLVGSLVALQLTLAVATRNDLPLLTRDSAVVFGFLLLAAGVPAAAACLALGAAYARWGRPRSSAVPRWLRWPAASPVRLAGIVVLLWAASVLAWQPVAFRTPPEAAVRPFAAPHGGRILLLGVDGLCWKTLRRWRDRDRNEDLHWFLDRAYCGPLATVTPTDSPLIWSTIATGVPPEMHGVTSFRSWEFAGLDRPRLQVPRIPGWSYAVRALRRLGLAELRPVSSLDMRRRPFWEIASRPDRPADVAGFWATWPPQPFHGRLVSDRFYFVKSRGGGSYERTLDPHTTFPPNLERRLARFRIAPDALSPALLLSFLDIPETEAAALAGLPWQTNEVPSEFPFALAMDETYYPLAEEFLADGAKDGLFAFYFRGVDIVSHPALRYSELYPEVPVSSDERQRYGKLISRYYAYTFSRLRRLVERAGENALVLIISDHGFEREGEAYFNHHFAPPGVLIALGGGAEKVRARLDAGIYDVAPTILWLAGYPPARDMPGRPLVDLFPDAGRTPLAPEWLLDSYGYRWTRLPVRVADDPKSEQQMLELLRTLGYIK